MTWRKDPRLVGYQRRARDVSDLTLSLHITNIATRQQLSSFKTMAKNFAVSFAKADLQESYESKPIGDDVEVNGVETWGKAFVESLVRG